MAQQGNELRAVPKRQYHEAGEALRREEKEDVCVADHRVGSAGWRIISGRHHQPASITTGTWTSRSAALVISRFAHDAFPSVINMPALQSCSRSQLIARQR